MIIFIFILSVFGFFVSWHIWRAKKAHQRLSCIIGQKNSCDIVVNSKYNSFLGVANEINGMLYYGFVGALSVLLVAGILSFGPISIGLILTIMGALGAVFSAILAIIQAFVLKQWCEWCSSLPASDWSA